MRTFAGLAILTACWAGCVSARTQDEAYLLQAGSLNSVRDPNLAAFVRTIGAGGADETAHRTLKTLLHGEKLAPAIEGDPGSFHCEAAVVNFRSETFVIVTLTSWGPPGPGTAWVRLILFDASGRVLDHLRGEIGSREGRIDVALTPVPEGRLACQLRAQPGAKVDVLQGTKRTTFLARDDRSNPVKGGSGVVCQVGIGDRKLKVLPSE